MTGEKLIPLALKLSVFAMGLFLYLFITRNAPGWVQPAIMSTMALVYGIVYAITAISLLAALRRPGDSGTNGRTNLALFALILLTLLLLVYVFLESAVFDYYQPLSLYDEAIAALATWWVVLIVAGTALLLKHAQGRIVPLAAMAVLALWALATWPLAGALQWINQPQPGDAVDFHQHVFESGEDGYAVYRIPGLVLIPAGSALATGTRISNDRLVAFAEARRDGALDQGVIDLVVKISNDGGRTWGEQTIVCRNEHKGLRGKCGNPAPVFDNGSGKLCLAYNLSGTEKNGRWHSGHVMYSGDGGISWEAPRQVSDDNFIFGPGKGLQKARPPHPGRLLLPGYANGNALVMYSDDSGLNWNRGSGLPGSDETDVAELSEGRLYLNTRHHAPIARPPEPNGRQFSLSADGGETWSATEIDTALTTPVCQASVLSTRSGGLLFSNPAHNRSRVNMTLRHSPDGGANWDENMLIYPGPSGYSVLAEGSDGSAYLLYENGNMSYSERISLAVIMR